MPQKYEREIEDILRRMGGTIPSESKGERARRWFGHARRRFSGRLRLVDAPPPTLFAITPGGLLAASLGVAFLSFVVQAIQPGVAAWLAILACLMFVGAIVFSVVRGRRRDAPKWRGRTMRDREGDESLWTDLHRRWRVWLARRQRGSRF